jgi:hypothetical protein
MRRFRVLHLTGSIESPRSAFTSGYDTAGSQRCSSINKLSFLYPIIVIYACWS